MYLLSLHSAEIIKTFLWQRQKKRQLNCQSLLRFLKNLSPSFLPDDIISSFFGQYRSHEKVVCLPGRISTLSFKWIK
jgi:hypothetical protein